MCYFNPVIIPDIVELLLKHQKANVLKGKIKVLASESAEFAEKCRSMFGENILANDDDIRKLKAGEKIFLISAQKLLVGLNAPLLRYCFISPTNSKIKIMQAIGRLMRPTGKVDRKLATLFLTSLSGKKLDLAEKPGTGTDKERDPKDNEPTDPDADENPKTRYTTTSMTMSEAYDLPIKVFYKTEVGFRDFINQTRIGDPNTVEKIKTTHIPKDELDKFEAIELRDKLNRLRDICRTNYKPVILKRDKYQCQGKKLVGEKGCNRGDGEVNLEIHHIEPWTFANIFKQLGYDGTIEWHRKADNLKHLVTLCTTCHDLLHAQEDDKEVAG
jgi:5-methylcytosine-specific restriction endonuclease McrA